MVAKSSSATEELLKVVKKKVEERHKLMAMIADSNMASPADIQRAKQVKDLQPLQDAWEEWKRASESLEELTPLLNDTDPAMRKLATEEHAELQETLSMYLGTILPSLILPPSTTSHLNAMIELKSGAGGAEASLFVEDLMKMYTGCAPTRGWNVDVMSTHELDMGGLKDAVIEVKGESAYDALRWENGVHRVQRVPATEVNGRTHTSAVAVAVLPIAEAEETASEEDELYSMSDIKLEVMRARGAGGQHVNTTESAVRLTHIPTGVTVSMQDERSQHQNRRRAFVVLRARLLDLKLAKEQADRRSMRRTFFRGMDRNDKIRTYNYSQDRVTDHRIGLTKKNLPLVMSGEGLGEFLDALKDDHEQNLLQDILEESKDS